MKVFHIFVLYVKKWQQKCASITKNVEKAKPSNNCVIENILAYHKMMTCNFDDEHWECEDNSNISRYIFYSILTIMYDEIK